MFLESADKSGGAPQTTTESTPAQQPATSTPPSPPEPSPQEPEEIINLDDLAVDELVKLDPNKPPVVQKKQEEKKTEEKKAEPKTSKSEKVPIEYDSEGNPIYLNEKGERITGDRLKDTQQALTKVQQQLKQTQQELLALKESQEAERFKDFEQLNDAEKEQYRLEDPEGYEEYLKEEQEFFKFQAEREQKRVKTQWEIILESTEELLKEELGNPSFAIDPTIPFQQQPPEVQKFIADVIKGKIDPYVTQNYKTNEMGLYTKDQIKAAYKILHLDSLIEKAKRGVREETIKDIEKAGKNASPLDTIPKSSGQHGGKKLEDLTPEEIASLTPEETDYYLKSLAKSS